jgi:hypothetical protein
MELAFSVNLLSQLRPNVFHNVQIGAFGRPFDQLDLLVNKELLDGFCCVDGGIVLLPTEFLASKLLLDPRNKVFAKIINIPGCCVPSLYFLKMPKNNI